MTTRRAAIAAMVGGMLAAPRMAQAQDVPYADVVTEAAWRWGVEPNWLIRVMMCESGGDPYAVNPVTGDTGLFQFNPNTWEAYGGGDIWNAWEQADKAAMMFSMGLAHLWVCNFMV